MRTSSFRSSSSSFNPVACCFVIFVGIVLAFNIAAIVIATEHADDPCQGPDKSGVSLHGWLLVSGIVGLCVSVITAAAFCGLLAFDWESCFIPIATMTLLSSIFTLAWFVVGIVIVARSNHSCVDDSTPLGVMSVIVLVLQGLSICGSKSMSTTNTN